MKTKNQLFSLDVLVGNWESVNLNPTVMIYKNGNVYLLSIIHINETTKQANPATYEIQEDESGYFTYCNLKRTIIDYDFKADTLNISSLGNYLRN
ncbi:hypothetical protein FACS1894159_07340 [Bacteroidia bacterium]|nr:hypothetical protein FACS1894159_07340 [Bacteroidia bacterium]